ncbi:MAG TPA: hypothetical protein VJ770_13965 [Stellaceae bacterium]|nr:hypothetical protein [Stellaceae bacterium]
MIRLGTLFWLLLAAGAAGGMYTVKYRVQGIEHALVKTEKATIAEQREIRVLEAEWTYLNRPAALAQMNTRFLSLTPVTAKALRTSVADLPMRPAPGEAMPDWNLVAVSATGAAAQPRVIPAVFKKGPAEAVARPLPSRHTLKAAAKAEPQSRAPSRKKSLDDLIARIVASR